MNSKLVLGKRTQFIINNYFENPSKTLTQLADDLKISVSRISQVLANPRVLAAYPALARRKRTSLIPKAIKRLDCLMDQNANLAVAFNATKAILDSEKVLEPNTQLHIHRLETMSIQELGAVIDEARKLPEPAIEAELIRTDKPND